MGWYLSFINVALNECLVKRLVWLGTVQFGSVGFAGWLAGWVAGVTDWANGQTDWLTDWMGTAVADIKTCRQVINNNVYNVQAEEFYVFLHFEFYNETSLAVMRMTIMEANVVEMVPMITWMVLRSFWFFCLCFFLT